MIDPEGGYYMMKKIQYILEDYVTTAKYNTKAIRARIMARKRPLLAGFVVGVLITLLVT